MEYPAIIFLSGYLKSGKDTVGNYLCTSHGFIRVAFADLLKDEVSITYDVTRETLDTISGKTPEIRQLLIQHGAKRRAENINYWIEKIWTTLLENLNLGKNIVLTDWRFENEFKVIKMLTSTCQKKVNTYTWRINRWDIPPLLDTSECGLDLFTFDEYINNTGSLEQLHQKIDVLLDSPSS